jgi:hypothetical protein
MRGEVAGRGWVAVEGVMGVETGRGLMGGEAGVEKGAEMETSERAIEVIDTLETEATTTEAKTPEAKTTEAGTEEATTSEAVGTWVV